MWKSSILQSISLSIFNLCISSSRRRNHWTTNTFATINLIPLLCGTQQPELKTFTLSEYCSSFRVSSLFSIRFSFSQSVSVLFSVQPFISGRHLLFTLIIKTNVFAWVSFNYQREISNLLKKWHLDPPLRNHYQLDYHLGNLDKFSESRIHLGVVNEA